MTLLLLTSHTISLSHSGKDPVVKQINNFLVQTGLWKHRDTAKHSFGKVCQQPVSFSLNLFLQKFQLSTEPSFSISILRDVFQKLIFTIIFAVGFNFWNTLLDLRALIKTRKCFLSFLLSTLFRFSRRTRDCRYGSLENTIRHNNDKNKTIFGLKKGIKCRLLKVPMTCWSWLADLKGSSP